MTINPNVPPVRRVVTGHDANGVAKVMIDAPATGGWASARLIWCTDRSPAPMPVGDFEDMGERNVGTAPMPHGSRFAVIDFPPGFAPVMHRTESIDYAIVLIGEIDMVMDDSTVTLRAGDVMVQRGTNHGWHNRSALMARIAFVLIDAEPLGIGNPITGSGRPGAP